MENQICIIIASIIFSFGIGAIAYEVYQQVKCYFKKQLIKKVRSAAFQYLERI
jgi:hypothetical protein